MEKIFGNSKTNIVLDIQAIHETQNNVLSNNPEVHLTINSVEKKFKCVIDNKTELTNHITIKFPVELRFEILEALTDMGKEVKLMSKKKIKTLAKEVDNTIKEIKI